MRVLARHSHPAALLTRWPAYSLIASTLAGLWLMQSAFNVAPLHTSLPDITAVAPVAGVVFGTGSPYRRIHPARSLRADRLSSSA